ncbi:MAG: HAD family hydrolase [Betaproteobacteria bacterium]|nr:HAD family hydrolase [Betaproteobacteria bacterium]
MILSLFDLDNTLLDGDSDYSWAQHLIAVGILDAATYEAENERYYRDYQAGRLDIHAFLSFQLAPLARYSLAQLEAWRAEFLESKIKPMILPEAANLVRERLDRGDRVAIITATNAFITRPIADLFGVEHLLATEPEIIAGRYTGKTLGTPCFQSGKILRLEAWLAGLGMRLGDFEESWFFSDSRNDLPLLGAVTHPIAVRPDPVLREHAERAGWPIISLRGED